MSIKLMTKVWNINIKPSLKLILLALADFSNDEGISYPSIDSIAEKCSAHRTNIIKNVQKLCELGYLKKDIRYKNGKKTTTLYRLNIELSSDSLRSEKLPKKSAKNELSSDSLRSEKSTLGSESLPDTIEPSVNRQYKCANARKRANSAKNYSCAFLAFYESYPRKRDKRRAWQSWLKNNHDEELTHNIMAGLKKYKKEIQLKNIADEFIKYPAAWLNGECWNDEYEVERQKVSEIFNCKKCNKKIHKNLALGGYCEKCADELFPFKEIQVI